MTKQEKTLKYEEEMLKVIKEKKICFFDHIFGFTSFCSATAYNNNLDKLESIRNAIKNNKVTAKNYMLNKWITGNNPTLQIAAMRLIADSEEHRKLNQSYVDHTTSGKEMVNIPIIEWVKSKTE